MVVLPRVPRPSFARSWCGVVYGQSVCALSELFAVAEGKAEEAMLVPKKMLVIPAGHCWEERLDPTQPPAVDLSIPGARKSAIDGAISIYLVALDQVQRKLIQILQKMLVEVVGAWVVRRVKLPTEIAPCYSHWGRKRSRAHFQVLFSLLREGHWPSV